MPPHVNQVLCDNILDILLVKSQVLGKTDSIGKIVFVFCLNEQPAMERDPQEDELLLLICFVVCFNEQPVYLLAWRRFFISLVKFSFVKLISF